MNFKKSVGTQVYMAKWTSIYGAGATSLPLPLRGARCHSRQSVSNHWTVRHRLLNHRTIKYEPFNYPTIGLALSTDWTIGHTMSNHWTAEHMIFYFFNCQTLEQNIAGKYQSFKYFEGLCRILITNLSDGRHFVQ